jgi:hypothetical protein
MQIHRVETRCLFGTVSVAPRWFHFATHRNPILTSSLVALLLKRHDSTSWKSRELLTSLCQYHKTIVPLKYHICAHTPIIWVS